MRVAEILSEIVVKMSEIQEYVLKIVGQVKLILKGKNTSAKTKSGIVGPHCIILN